MRPILLFSVLLHALAPAQSLAGERILYCIAAERQPAATCTLENGEGGLNDHFEAAFPAMDGSYTLPAEFAFSVRSSMNAGKLQGSHAPARHGYGSFLATIAAPEDSGTTIDPAAAGSMTLRSVKLTVDPALL